MILQSFINLTLLFVKLYVEIQVNDMSVLPKLLEISDNYIIYECLWVYVYHMNNYQILFTDPPYKTGMYFDHKKDTRVVY